MADYPGAIDGASSLYTPVNAFSGTPLETTTTGAVLAGDSTINVASTSGLCRELRHPLDRRRARGVHRQDGVAVQRVPAWGLRDRRLRPRQRRGGEREHGRGLHHRAPVGGPGHRERVGHRRRAQLHPEGRRGHGHRPQDLPGRRGVRRGYEGRDRPGTPAQCGRGQVEEAGQLGRPRHGSQREQPPRDGRHHRLRGGPDLRRVLVIRTPRPRPRASSRSTPLAGWRSRVASSRSRTPP